MGAMLEDIRYDYSSRDASLLEFDTAVATPQRTSTSISNTGYH